VRGGEIRVANRRGPDGGLFVGAGLRLVAAGVVGLAGALVLGLTGAFPKASGSGSVTGTRFDGAAALESEDRTTPGWVLASFETRLVSAAASDAVDVEPVEPVPNGRSRFGPRVASYVISLDARQPPTRSPHDLERGPSFEEHWKAATLLGELDSTETANQEARPRHEIGRRLASLTPADFATESKNLPRAIDLPDADDQDHTAIYDIAAHTVYLPDGKRLEAHSGLGRLLDNPRFVHMRDRGPTPPNVYDLSLRERHFHGVRALRLTPAESDRMFGRDGILAHSYMHGGNGQSNGCVAFRDYPAFLNAYLRGDINRLVVVDHLANTPGAATAAGWVPETVKAPPGRS
jgi:Protein of unknown function (DUF2778)